MGCGLARVRSLRRCSHLRVGPDHSGSAAHGFLAYLMKCTAIGRPYTVHAYKGKEVRDNIHSANLVTAFECAAEAPRVGAVYNMGGGRRDHPDWAPRYDLESILREMFERNASRWRATAS